MPRYFFHVYHDRTELDFVGEELSDKEVMDEFEGPLYVLHINAEQPR